MPLPLWLDVAQSRLPDGSAVLHQRAYFVSSWNRLRLFTRGEASSMKYVHTRHINRTVVTAPAEMLHGREK